MDSIEGHTELPWHTEGPDDFGDYNILHDGDSLAVGAVVSNLRSPKEVAANAALIVRAVNSHHALVEALKAIEPFIAKSSASDGGAAAHSAAVHAADKVRDALRLAGEAA